MSDPFAAGLRRLRRRTLVRRLTVAGVLLAVLVATVLLWPRPEPGPLAVAVASGPVAPGGVLDGRLDAARSGDRVCYAMTVRSGRAVLAFPRGWSADEDLGLLDTSGLVVAGPGDLVTAIGDPGPIGRAQGCAERGRVWTVTSVRVERAS